MNIEYHPYDSDKDKEAVHRIWFEVGWMTKGDEKEIAAADIFIECSRALVARIDGEPECAVLSASGEIRHVDQDIPFAAVTSVTTSHVARKQGLASRLTARAIAKDASDGAMVVGLGIFEQGFYNQLGFGNGSYEHWASFDPARLRIPVEARIPRRLTHDDWEMVHAARLARRRGHGAVNLHPVGITRGDMAWSDKSFGLGYCDGPDGALSHHVWLTSREMEHGPYQVLWMTYQTAEQFLELMALIRNLGDQVRLIQMREPQSIQLQDLLECPFTRQQISERSKFESRIRAKAYWQMRICDLAGCLDHTHLRGDTVRFNLSLSDPIERFLPDDEAWRGLSGDYVVDLGPSSGAEPGRDPTLPTLSASVGAFTRLWLGVQPASGLAVTDDLSAPPALLEQLDWGLRLPQPKPDWDF